MVEIRGRFSATVALESLTLTFSNGLETKHFGADAASLGIKATGDGNPVVNWRWFVENHYKNRGVTPLTAADPEALAIAAKFGTATIKCTLPVGINEGLAYVEEHGLVGNIDEPAVLIRVFVEYTVTIIRHADA